MGLTACMEPLSPEQQAEQLTRNLPLAEAAVPACMASALGRQPSYSGVTALGYKNYKPLLTSGVSFKSPDSNALLGKGTSLTFNGNEGCSASYSSETDSFGIIGEAWMKTLEKAGYKLSPGSNGTFQFVANGIPMEFQGTHRITNYSNVMSFTIQRKDR